ncbi:myozenin-3 isoform X2 [Peromyscus leucopus]|uniref:myozenin-3 isoform X2 n=1 Tax=Peromyscus leucopus TaxID=10041 RepID=UPI0010A123B6|nr:myozenin-3 isoform X2 [Peromyscus leucopus]
MIPKEQKEPVMAVTGDLAEPVPSLDLGKKLSVPQDLMIEELSLCNNPGSLLFQKRQRRVQKFTFELSESLQSILAGSARGKAADRAALGTVPNGLEEQNHRSELHVFQGSPGDPRIAHPGVAGVESVRSPSALAPGYAEPLKGIPPEKFNHTAIPKGYRCPWQEFVSYRDYPSGGGSLILRDYRNFNKTPVPFGGPRVGETIFQAGTTPFVPEPFSGLELLRLRPSFNRVAQGWVRKLPESEEL